MLVGHGSKAAGFDRAMKRVARELGASCAYLEINEPSIGDAIDRAVKNGAKKVRVLPYFLLTGRHVTEHIPAIVREAQARHRRKASIRLCPYLGYDARIVGVAKDRLRG